jgi:16S rRNA (cytosine967-C5)-methyltransferase
MQRLPVQSAELFGQSAFVTPDGDLRTLPCHFPDADSRFSGIDGFYAARLVKQ